MKVYEEKEVPIIKKTLVKVTCDVCKKEINTVNDYYEVTTGHNDWGNDSYDSVEYKDICSDKCLKQEFDSYLKSSYDSKYINIEKGKGI